ncbi:MAG: hypothetical protein J6D30_01625 [Clostridia bacterium]|nr:hypothetical protein [Clostridia bacterium]
MLMNDIDFADEAGNPTEFHAFTCWNSAFDANTKVTTGWTGIFDGNGYALKNVIPSTDNRNSKYSSDASIFGIIDAKGVIRNLKVYARIEYRGGVVASLINSNGTIENCYVEATVAPTLADHTTSKPFGGIIFRSQKDGILQNNVAIITLEKNEAGTTAASVAVSGNVAVGYGKSYNNLSIVTTGETVKALTTTNTTTVNTNNVCFVSYDAFFATEGGADYSTYNTSVWNIDATNKTIGLIAGCSYKA